MKYDLFVIPLSIQGPFPQKGDLWGTSSIPKQP